MKPSSKDKINEGIHVKRKAIDRIIRDMKEGFKEIGNELKKELNEATIELNWHREDITDVLGFEDSVKGFDMEFMTDDTIDFLDVYADFLG